MTPLITLSHGSRNPRAAAGIASLTRRAGALLGLPGAASASAHLEFSRPSLPEAAVRLARAGHRDATVVPLLFTDAYHHRTDVPVALAEAEEASGLRLHLGGHLGLGTDIAELLAAGVPSGAHVVVYPVGTSDAAATLQTVELAERVGELAGCTAEMITATCGGGPAALEEAARRHPRLHLAPLFVTEGLLLDQALAALPGIAARTGAEWTAGAPLGDRLGAVVAQRTRLLAVAR